MDDESLTWFEAKSIARVLRGNTRSRYIRLKTVNLL